MAEYASLTAGDPAPWFHQRSGSNPRYTFDVAAGRYLVLCFYATARDAQSRAAIDAAFARPDIFDDIKASFFGVSLDQGDEAEKRIGERIPGYRVFWDFDGRASAAYGVIPRNAQDARRDHRPAPLGSLSIRPCASLMSFHLRKARATSPKSYAASTPCPAVAFPGI